jgi:Ca2+-binding EF-hand superfamily protein
VSADKTNFSVSFNEFLRLTAMQRESEPDQETLVQVFASFDKDNIGMISESSFRKIMSAKDDVDAQDIADMLEEYYRCYIQIGNSAS